MKTNRLLAAAAGLLAIALVAGCASTPKKGVTLTKEQILQQDDVKKKKPLVFNKGLEEVRQAGMRALVFVGCKVKVQQPLYLAGLRPSKFGLFVGSGGETIEMFFYPQSETETHVWVDTDLSFGGIAGQQNWDDRVVAELKKILEETPASQ